MKKNKLAVLTVNTFIRSLATDFRYHKRPPVIVKLVFFDI